MPENDPENPDEGLPEDGEDDDCARPADVFRMPTENLPGDNQ